nr:retrovirus-related Pol polyprotein from transposon TNT 1-94 [Tanacetum cinerariifolium]
MTGNLKLLRNFVEKFMGTIHFGNDNFTTITGYGDYVQGNLTICHVYYVEELRHNLFSVRQLCGRDIKVTFRSNTCYVRNLEGEDLLTGSRDFNLYTISISEMAASSLVYLLSKATSTKSWLWNRRLSYFNFGTINHLTKQDSVVGLLRFKYDKDHLCSACEQGKSKKATFPPKLILKVSDNSAANTLNKDTPLSSSIIIKDHDASQMVSSSKEPIAQEPTSPVFNNNSDEQAQEDVAELDGNTFMNPFVTPEFKEAESSSNYQDPSNMHEFHQQRRFTDR